MSTEKEDREQESMPTEDMLDAGADAYLQMKDDWAKLDKEPPPLGPLLACAYRAMVDAAPAESALSQSASDKVDARRYRWLRDNADINLKEYAWVNLGEGRKINIKTPMADELNQIIDRALTGTKP